MNRSTLDYETSNATPKPVRTQWSPWPAIVLLPVSFFLFVAGSAFLGGEYSADAIPWFAASGALFAICIWRPLASAVRWAYSITSSWRNRNAGDGESHNRF